MAKKERKRKQGKYAITFYLAGVFYYVHVIEK